MQAADWFCPFCRLRKNRQAGECQRRRAQEESKIRKVRQKVAPNDSENPSKPHAAENPSKASNSDDKKLKAGPGPFAPEKQSNCVALKEKWGLAFAFAEKAGG